MMESRPSQTIPAQLAWLLIACALAASAAAHAADTLTLGIFAFRPKPVMVKQYQPLVDYLNQQIQEPHIDLQILDQDEMEVALAQKRLDLIFTNPSHYMVLRNRNQLTGALATLVRKENGQTAQSLGGVIISSAERPKPATLGDLKGRRIAVPGTKFLGGYQTQAFELLQAGIRLPDDVQLYQVKGHDAVVQAVLDGEVDAGFIRTSIIESLTSEGKLDPTRLRVINRQDPPGFPFLVSTRLYPEWPFVALPHVEHRTVRRIASALLALEEDHPAVRAAGIVGFAPPADYLPVEELGRTLRLPPFDKAPNFTWRDEWNKHRNWLLALMLLAAAGARILLLSQRTAQANRRFNQLFENIPEPILLLDNGRFIDCNPATSAALGYTDKHAILGKSPADLSPQYQADGENSAEKAQRVLSELHHSERQQFEWVCTRADGSEMFLDATLMPFDLGRRRVALVALHDITERKRAEEALRQLNETLEQRVRQEVDKNLDQERLLIQQSRFAAMGEMIGNIAHQWRQPLNALGLLLSNIKDAHDYQELDAATLQAQTAKGRQLIEKMSTTIDDFRNFFKPNKVKENFSLSDSIASTLNLIGQSLASNGITTHVAGGENIQVHGFPNEFSQVQLNIFSNAKDVLLEKKVSHGLIDITLGMDGNTAWVAIRDNAGGIPADILPRIFDPYFTTKEKGTGIGLYMSKVIMEHMDGNIEVRNTDGGAEFRLSLPRAS